jgi:CPA1 family monovalent cation:H+ antiporter
MMAGFEYLLAGLWISVGLAALARRVGAPYPAFLALGGVVLAFVPNVPRVAIDPELALAIFVAPVLLDAAYDSSLRDLRRNWIPLSTLVVGAVILTTAAVAVVARLIVPAMPWPAAIALGAIVAPPDAAAATAVLGQMRSIPHRALVILQGESLLNDATALLIYRLAVGAVLAHGFDAGRVAPTFLLAVAGSLVFGPVMARLFLAIPLRDIPTSIIVQFLGTFGIWVVAERLGLSAVLTMVAFAVAVAQRAPRQTPARMRLPSYAVWETTVFVLNVAAFVFIGLQIRPILGALSPSERATYLLVAAAIVVTVIVVRIVWVLLCVGVVQWTAGQRAAAKRAKPSTILPGSVVIAWCGMRGIVTLATALALPAYDGASFPYRDLIIVAAFSVVLSTLIVQGLTLKLLVRALDLRDGDPVGREVVLARERALNAALETFAGDFSTAAAAVREELQSVLGSRSTRENSASAVHDQLRREALGAARRTALDLRDQGDIGDDAFHAVEELLDYLEISDQRNAEAETAP